MLRDKKDTPGREETKPSNVDIKAYEDFFNTIFVASWDQQHEYYSILQILRENLFLFLRKFLLDQEGWSPAKKSMLMAHLNILATNQFFQNKSKYELPISSEKKDAEQAWVDAIIKDIADDLVTLKNCLDMDTKFDSKQFMDFLYNLNWTAQTTKTAKAPEGLEVRRAKLYYVGSDRETDELDDAYYLEDRRLRASDYQHSVEVLKGTNRLEALQYAQKAVFEGKKITVSLLSNQEDESNLISYKATLAEAYYFYGCQLKNENKLQDALEYFNRALEIYKEIQSHIGRPEFVDRIYQNLAKIYGLFAKAISVQNNLEEAIEYREKAIGMLDKILFPLTEDKIFLIDLLNVLSNDFFRLAHYQKAEQYAENAIELCSTNAEEIPGWQEACKPKMRLAEINCVMALTKLADRCLDHEDYNQGIKHLLLVIKLCCEDLLPDENCKVKPMIVGILNHATTRLMNCAIFYAGQNTYTPGILLAETAIKAMQSVPTELSELVNPSLVPRFQMDLFIMQVQSANYWLKNNNHDDFIKQLIQAYETYKSLSFDLLPKEPTASFQNALLNLARMLDFYVINHISESNQAKEYLSKIVEIYNRVPTNLRSNEDEKILKQVQIFLNKKSSSPVNKNSPSPRLFVSHSAPSESRKYDNNAPPLRH